MDNGIHELSAGYALDVLDADERWAFEAHLAECERCREDLRSFGETTEALAIAAAGPVPSVELRDRILASARAERQVVVPLESRRRVVPVLGAAAAIAAVVALAIGLWATQLSGELDDARLALDRERQAAAVLADPGARTVALEAGDGHLVVDDDGRAVIVLDGLDPAPEGKTYELWIIEGEKTSPAGLFRGRDGLDWVGVDGTVNPGDVVAVTIEKAGGVQVSQNEPIAASAPL